MSKYGLILLFIGFLFNPANHASAAECGSQNPSQCGDFTVCTLATTIENGKRKWDTGNAYLAFLEAKKRGLSCSVGLSSSVAIDAKRRTTTSSKESSYYTQCSTTPVQLKNLQTVLKKLGLYSSVIDGVYGPGTQKAIREAKTLIASNRDQKNCISTNELNALNRLISGDTQNSKAVSAELDLERMQQQIDNLTKQNETYQSENQSLKARVAVLSQTINALSSLNETDNITSTNRALENKLGSVEANNEKLAREIRLLNTQKKSLEIYVEDLRTRLDKVNTTLSQLTQLNPIIPPTLPNEQFDTPSISETSTSRIENPSSPFITSVISTILPRFTEEDGPHCYLALKPKSKRGYGYAFSIPLYLIATEDGSMFLSDFGQISEFKLRPENITFELISNAPSAAVKQVCAVKEGNGLEILKSNINENSGAQFS
ncbi:MAG: hypothetical protein L7U52_04745, partial [Alphaproteobacteria bacterium]|nr:hypothetical protein [Alphaproteobacteria bacterium]